MIIMGVDLGYARTGLSICDREERMAVPLHVVHERNETLLVQKLSDAAHERKAEEIVVGLPINMDGTEGESAAHAREIAEKLAVVSMLPVAFMDERGTTVTAHNLLNDTNKRGKKRKAAVDAVAATIILQDYLNYRRNKSME